MNDEKVSSLSVGRIPERGGGWDKERIILKRDGQIKLLGPINFKRIEQTVRHWPFF